MVGYGLYIECKPTHHYHSQGRRYSGYHSISPRIWRTIQPISTPPISTSSPQQDGAASETPIPTSGAVDLYGVPVLLIPLTGPAAEFDSEISGLAWYKDTLLLLPQYPRRQGESSSGLTLHSHPPGDRRFRIRPHAGIINPRHMGISALEQRIFQASKASRRSLYPASACHLTIETHSNYRTSYLVSGSIEASQRRLAIDIANRVLLPLPVELPNSSYEALVVAGRRLIEPVRSHGAELVAAPQAPLFDLALNGQGALPMTGMEYRLTDATSIDDAGRFWVINYFFPGYTFLPPGHRLAQEYGLGLTHSRSQVVERLVELQLSEQGLVFTDEPPIPLLLDSKREARNWEGIARLEGHGFLLATDRFPAVILLLSDPYLIRLWEENDVIAPAAHLFRNRPPCMAEGNRRQAGCSAGVSYSLSTWPDSEIHVTDRRCGARPVYLPDANLLCSG